MVLMTKLIISYSLGYKVIKVINYIVKFHSTLYSAAYLDMLYLYIQYVTIPTWIDKSPSAST